MNRMYAMKSDEALASGNNAYVRKQQHSLDKYAGRDPKMPSDMYGLKSAMVLNGEHAERLTDKLLAGWDKVAFPRK